MTRHFAAALAAGLAMAAAGAAQASTAAVTGFSGGVFVTAASDQLYGWVFDANSPVDITALGVGDATGGALANAHDVGIFDMDTQSLLVSATVPAGSGGNLLDGFMYEDLQGAFHLDAGSYAIIMTMPTGTPDLQSVLDTSVTTAPQITYLHSAFGSGSSLAFTSTTGFEKGMFGPNFLFDAVGAALPEPGSWALMIGGFGLAGATLRRRRETTAA